MSSTDEGAGAACIRHVSDAIVPTHFVDWKLKLSICVQAPAASVLICPPQSVAEWIVIVPPHVATVEHPHGPHAIVKSPPTRCFVGALAGQGTSAARVIQTARAAGAVHSLSAVLAA